MPYLNRDKEVNGVVITFIDITTITQLNNTIRAVLNASHGIILAFAAVRSGHIISDFQLVTANPSAEELLKRPITDATGMSMKKDLQHLAVPSLFEQYIRVVNNDIVFQKDLTSISTKSGTRLSL